MLEDYVFMTSKLVKYNEKIIVRFMYRVFNWGKKIVNK